MKYRSLSFALLTLCAAWLLSMPVQAQLVRVGLKGGFELTQMDFSTDALRNSNRAGFYVGPQLKFKLPVVGLGIEGSLLYSQRDMHVDGETLKQKSILMPVHARYGASIGEVVGVFFTAGPQFSFNVGDDIFYWKDEDDSNNQFSLQTTMLSINFGIGASLGPNLEAAVFYNVPLGKTADFTWDNLGNELKSQEWSRAKSRTNAWHIALSYFF